MKTIVFISVIVLFFLPIEAKTIVSNSEDNFQMNLNDGEILVFDGYEGGYLFFTNDDDQAIVLELENENLLNKIDLVNGDFIGKRLRVKYLEKKPDDESSSIGIIKQLELT